MASSSILALRIKSRRARTRRRTVLSFVSFAIIALLAIICLCPTGAKAQAVEEDKYGHVIGIGETICHLHSDGGSDSNFASLADLGTT